MVWKTSGLMTDSLGSSFRHLAGGQMSSQPSRRFCIWRSLVLFFFELIESSKDQRSKLDGGASEISFRLARGTGIPVKASMSATSRSPARNWTAIFGKEYATIRAFALAARRPAALAAGSIGAAGSQATPNEVAMSGEANAGEAATSAQPGRSPLRRANRWNSNSPLRS